jgi:capsular polysaccharide biosynthesis protein
MLIEQLSKQKIIREYEKHPRKNNVYIINNCIITGRSSYYPNCLLYSNNKLITPYDEKVMSLNKESFYDNNYENLKNSEIKKNKNKNKIKTAVYFFIYNFDNYYHFIYDTLPYLINFHKLKKELQHLKLLVNYPKKDNKFYKFNTDLFELLKLEIIIHNDDNEYETLYIANSLTHGGKSNEKPNDCVYDFFNILKQNCGLGMVQLKKKIYISRRTWMKSTNDNIGTNYTLRRKILNEDLIVEILKDNGFDEIFAEDFALDDKIKLFKNASYIIGAVGGGMCNLLFSSKEAKTLCIVSPDFLNVNARFKYSMENTNITYFYDCYHNEYPKIPLYTRVIINDNISKYYNKIGEITKYNEKSEKYEINVSNNDIVGFNSEVKYDVENIEYDKLKLLDNGLNSPFYIDEIKFRNALKIFLE